VPGVSDPREQFRGRWSVLRPPGTGFLCGWLKFTRCDVPAGICERVKPHQEMEVSEAGNGCALGVSPLLLCPCVDPRHIKARRPRRPTILPPSCLSSQHPPLPRSSRSSPRLSDFLTRSSRLGPHLSVSLDSLVIMQPLHRAASLLDSLVIATLR
jgi:hypothetical protein